MSAAPILSVVIVAYKSRDEIGACVGSLPRDLLGRPVEVIVVDNSPGDGAGAIIQGRFPHAKYLPAQENLGFGRANNRGYAASSGEYVLFLNPDTVSNNAALEHCLITVGRPLADAVGRPASASGRPTIGSGLADAGGIGLISPRLVLADGTMDAACRRSIPTLWDGFARASGLAAAFPGTALFAGYNLTHLPEGGTYEVGAINGAFMLAPRRALEAVAPDGKVFDEQFFMYGDDLDLCIRIARLGWKIVYDGRVSIVHLKGLSVAKDYARMSTAIFDANRDVYLKHFARSSLARLKYRFAFSAWKSVALLRARMRGHRKVKPV